MSKYYFTGTRAQLLELCEKFDKQASFVEGEKTFSITVDDVTEEPQVNEVEEQDNVEHPAHEEESVEPATDPVVDDHEAAK